MAVSITRYSGADIEPFLDDLARLRIEVFRAFPYLYEGSMTYEQSYLKTYARSPDSLFVLARDGDQVVGAATGIPMADETEEFRRPFRERGMDPERIFYFGESVLLPAHRGQGIGVGFFEHREDFARKLGRFDHCCFCAVERPADHPRRPEEYTPLDQFWHNRGYQKLSDLQTHYRWTDVGDDEPSDKLMTFWLRRLD